MENPYIHLDEDLREEAEFADTQYSSFADDLDVNPTMLGKYTHPTAPWDWRQLAAQLLGDIRGKAVLDFGCGMGEESIYLAKLGARVWAIDISEVGIALTKKRATHNGLSERVRARVMRVDPTEFDDASFDVVHGLGILHHVELDVALAEVRRLLKPGGTAVFLEPLGNSPTVEALKNWLMQRLDAEVTDHEENLRLAELRRFAPLFSRMEIHPYHLLYRAKRFFPAGVRDYLRRIDHAVLTRIPPLEYYAGAAVIHLVK